jgi:hypothetical protein
VAIGQNFSEYFAFLLPVIMLRMLNSHHQWLYNKLHHQGAALSQMVAMVSITVSWDMMPFGIVGGYQCSSKTFVTTYKTTGIKTQNTTMY